MKTSGKLFVFLALAAFALTGCGEEEVNRTAKVRFKTILVLKVAGEIREFSSVMQVENTRITKSLMGAGGKGELWGEAVVIDLGKRGTAYMLAYSHDAKKYSGHSYHGSFMQSFGINGNLGTLKQINNNPYREEFETTYPLIVAFKDEDDPKSIYLVELDDLSPAFGRRVKFQNIFLEITDEEITTGELFKHLPWLKKRYGIGFGRMPKDRKARRRDRSYKSYINYGSFIQSEFDPASYSLYLKSKNKN